MKHEAWNMKHKTINNEQNYNYLIGVDGGGTKTVAAISDLNGRILGMAKAGPSNPRNVGIKETTRQISLAISQLLKSVPAENGKILATIIGLAGVKEEFENKKEEIKEEIRKYPEAAAIFEGKIEISNDQIVAFRSAKKGRDGLVLISGTGSVCHGWNKNKEAKTSGWGWLNDEGSAFWAGQEAFRAMFRDLDGRGPKTLITKIAFQALKAKSEDDFLLRIYYGNPTFVVPLFSIYCNQAARKGDQVAKKIMTAAGQELALAAKTVIKKLGFANKNFPVVLIGGMFKSDLVLMTVKKEIKKLAPQAVFVLPREDPVIGAIELAKDVLQK